MKMTLVAAIMASSVLSAGLTCFADPHGAPRAVIPPVDQSTLPPMQKPLPVDPVPQQPQQPQATLEQVFVDAYINHRSPRMMIFVNRTIHGDPVAKDTLNELAHDTKSTPDEIGATPDDYAM